jgi:alkaline phosphatase D
VLPRFKFYAELLSWYPRSRQRLFDAIENSGVEGLVFLSGDVHYGELTASCREDIGYPLYEITSSGITHSISSSLPLRLLDLGVYLFAIDPSVLYGPYTNLNYAELTFDWSRSSPVMKMSLLGEHNHVAFHFQVTRQQLTRASPKGSRFQCALQFEEDKDWLWLLLNGWPRLYGIIAVFLFSVVVVPLWLCLQISCLLWKRRRASTLASTKSKSKGKEKPT